MVSKFTQPDMTMQTPVEYKAFIDAAISVLGRLGAGFSPFVNHALSLMSVYVQPGAIFNNGTGQFVTSSESGVVLVAPGSDSYIARIYIDKFGDLGVVYGAVAASPVVPNYPVDVFPICRVTLTSATTEVTNDMLIDERAFAARYGTPRNSYLFSSSGTFVCPTNAKFLRITCAGAGGGGGGGASSAADAAKYAGGGGGGAGSVINRMFNPENLTIVIGAGGTGGNSAATAAVAATAGTAGGATSVTGAASALAISCAGGGGGGAATAAANGAVGTAGAAGTGVAGTAGSAGVANTNGGNGGGTGTSASLSAGGKGAILASTRIGNPGVRGSGGGGGIGFQSGAKGGNGGGGFVLIEVF